MAFTNPDDEVMGQLLMQANIIAVIGLSPKTNRPSYRVAKALQSFGYHIIPVVGWLSGAKQGEDSSGTSAIVEASARPRVKEVLGQPAYSRLEDVPDKIDLVNVFRAPRYVDDIVDSCIELGIPAIWLQEGVVNVSAAQRARVAGLTVVMDRCTYKDYVRLCK